jgi:hypothetical protein
MPKDLKMLKDKKPDPVRASETLVKCILYLNIVLLIISFFKNLSVMIILILNTLLLLLRQGIKKDSDKIVAYRNN